MSLQSLPTTAEPIPVETRLENYPIRSCFNCSKNLDTGCHQICVRCQWAMYCSLECAAAHYTVHGPQCNAFANAIVEYEIQNLVNYPQYYLWLPPCVNFLHVHNRLQEWRIAHGWLFPWTCLQALYSPTDPHFICNNLLLMLVTPRWDDSNLIRRTFRVKGFACLTIADVTWTPEFEVAKRQINDFYSQSRPPHTYQMLMLIWCPPLEPAMMLHTVPPDFVTRDYHRPDWREATVADIEEGSPTSPLVVPRPPAPRKRPRQTKA